MELKPVWSQDPETLRCAFEFSCKTNAILAGEGAPVSEWRRRVVENLRNWVDAMEGNWDRPAFSDAPDAAYMIAQHSWRGVTPGYSLPFFFLVCQP